MHRYGLDLEMIRLKHTSEVNIHVSILTRNYYKRLESSLGIYGAEFSGVDWT